MYTAKTNQFCSAPAQLCECIPLSVIGQVRANEITAIIVECHLVGVTDIVVNLIGWFQLASLDDNNNNNNNNNTRTKTTIIRENGHTCIWLRVPILITQRLSYAIFYSMKN